MTEDQSNLPAIDEDLGTAELRGLVSRLDEPGRRFVETYDGSNKREALAAAGLKPNAFHMRITRNESFRRVVGAIDNARRAVVAHQVTATLAPEAEPLVDELKMIALGPAKGARELDAKLRAITIALRILGVATEAPAPTAAVTVNVQQNNIDSIAARQWAQEGGSFAWRNARQKPREIAPSE